MPVRSRFFVLLAFLIIPAFACQATSGLFESAPTALLATVESTPTIEITDTLTPSPSSTWTLTPSPTPIPPTLTPTASPSPSPTATIVVTPSLTQLSVFEELWQTIHDDYLYPDFNGLDWDEVGAEYRQQVEDGLTDEMFFHTMNEMIARLGDDHSVYLSPQLVIQEDSEFAGENDYVGIGVFTSLVPERKRATIILVFPGSPADLAGLDSHDSILAVDGQPIVDETGFRRDLLQGPEGSPIELTVQTPGDEPRQVSLTRQRVISSIPVPYSELITPDGRRVGYILLATFADETVDDQVGDALQALTESGPLDGVILDNRPNSGGADYVARRVLGYFTRGVVGHFINRLQRQRALNVVGTDINGSSQVPLVVLVGPDTVSFGEISSGVLRDMGRAYVIGELTDGNIELLRGYEFEDGSRLWLAQERFVPRNNPDENWELTGIIPDLTVASNWDEVTLQTDPAVQAALQYFDTH